nr:hypothetical protein [Tanacetum cinerariifolium]
KHFKTLCLDESRSPNFDLFSDQEEYSNEEVAETMAETMEQYMSKTRADYGSGVSRPKIKDKDNFESKGQFLKELRDNTFSGSDHEDVKEYIKKVLEIVDLFHIPNITIDQVMLRAFFMSLTRSISCWVRNKPSGLITNWEDLKTKFRIKYCPLARFAMKMEEINNFQGAIPSKTIADAKIAIQEMAEYSQKWHNGTSSTKSTKTYDELAAIQAQLNNLGREIKKVNKKVYVTQVGCEQCKDPHYTKDCPLKEEGKPLEEAFYTQFGLGKLAHTKLTVELADRTVKYPKGIAKNVLVDHFVYLHSKIDVFKRKITLRIREEKIIFKTVKHVNSLIKRVYMLGLREKMELDLEARLMGETLVLHRSLDPFFEDYIELNDLNIPLELRRDQVDNLMPTIEEGEVVEEFRARNDARMVSKFFGYPSDCDHDKKTHMDYAYNLKFSCMIDFGVLEDIDAYRDKGMGDVIFGESFLREVRINARWFDGMITIYNGNDEVTYQMVQSHQRFKHHTNKQCSKIPPLLKMGIVRETLTEGTEGAHHLGPERPRVYSDLSPKENDRYNADIRATNILLQGVPKDIYTLINHYTDAKDIWDNVKMLLGGSELTKKTENHNCMMTLNTFNRIKEKPFMPTMSGQGNNPRGEGAAGYVGVHNRVRNANPGQARQIKCYNCNDDCDAFDFDFNEAPTAQTMFMANLSSADLVYDEAGLLYDSDILSEYVKDNTVPGVQCNVSFVPNDAYMIIYNDMYEPHA